MAIPVWRAVNLNVANGKRKTAGGYVWMYERG